MTPNKQIIDAEKLKVLVRTGKEGVEAAQLVIDRNKLPYIIVKHDKKVSACHRLELLPDGKCQVCGGITTTVQEVYELRSSYSQGELFLNRFITVDPETIEMKIEASKISKTQYETLVCGETGTGKDLIASSQIDDRKGQLKVVNCSGFPRDLIESELFGHMKGSFTGAYAEKDGLIHSAENGVMFLDEIGDLPMDMQAKLLRAIQYKVVRKVGSNKEEEINCKFVFATNKDLRKLVKLSLFREDLYARISTLELVIKPLRDRVCDIVPICKSLPGGEEFLSKYEHELKYLDLSLNVRSLQQYIIRHSVLGRIK